MNARVFARQTAGRHLRAGLTARVVAADGVAQADKPVSVALDGAPEPASFAVRAERAGVHVVRALVAEAEGSPSFDLAATVVARRAGQPDRAAVMQAGSLAVEPLLVAGAEEIGALNLWWADGDDALSRHDAMIGYFSIYSCLHTLMG